MRLRTFIFLLFNLNLLITAEAGVHKHFKRFICLPDTQKIVKTDTLLAEELEEEINYAATDSIRFETDSQRIYLFGDAEVDYGEMELKAERIEIDNKKNIVTAFGIPDSTGKLVGTPQFKDRNNEMKCERMVYNTKTKKGKIYGVLTKQADLLVYGEAIKKDTNNVLYIQNAKCIPCEYEDSKFYFRAKKAKIIPDDKVVTGPIFVEVSNVPTPLALPFGYFPNVKNKSKAGILIPYYGESPGLGFFLRDGGFFIPISDKINTQFRGDIYTQGSWGLKNQTDYYVRYKFQGNLSLGYSVFKRGEREIPTTYSEQKDFFVRWTHNQDMKNKPNVRFSANVNAGSSSYNTLNNQNTQQYLTNTFQSNILYSRTFRLSNLSLNIRHNQNTLTRDMEASFPEMTFNVNRFFPFKNQKRVKQNVLDKIGISYLFEGKSFLREKDTSFFKEQSLKKIQYGARHTVPISTNFNLLKYFTVTPAANLSSVMYMKSLKKEWDTLTEKIVQDTVERFAAAFDANVSASIATKLFGDYVFKRFKRLKQIRHFVIPSVSASYHPNMTDPKLGFYNYVQSDTIGNRILYNKFENGIYGGPSGGESGIISWNVNNNLEAKVRKFTDSSFTDKKVPLLQNLSFSGSYNLSLKEYNWSYMNITGRTRIWKNLDVLFSGAFDPYSLDSLGRRQNKTELETNQVLGRLVNGNLALNAAFTRDLFLKEGETLKGDELPWMLNLSYNLNYSRPGYQWTEQVTQTLNFNGDVSITKKWRVGFMSGWDFRAKNFSYTSFNVYRDLRCWEARIEWVPFGFNKRYTIAFNLKSSALRDIRIPRTRSWYDNF